MKILKSNILIWFFAVIFLSNMSCAQGDKSQRPSPPATAEGTVSGAHIRIEYSAPAVKGRTIWGGLVPYDKFWRAGANEATIFTTDRDIQVEGKTLPKGSYSIFAKPGKNEWTFVFNSETGQGGIRGGAANFDPANNVIEITVKSGQAPEFHERMAFEVTDQGFSLIWENLKVPVSIR